MAAHFPSMARSVFDPSVYGEVARQRAGRTIGYFALVVLAASLLVTVWATLAFRSAIHKYLVPELDSMPVITIRNGEASATGPQPWVRSFEDDGVKTLIAIDTTGKMTGFQPKEQGFLLTRTHMMMKNLQKAEERSFELRDVDDVVIDAKAVKAWIPKALALFFAGVLIAVFLWYAVAKLFFALVLSLVGLCASATRPRAIGYGQVMTIALYAMTPAIVLDLLEIVSPWNVPHFWLLYLAVGAAYTALGVRRAPDEAPPAPAPAGGGIQPQPPATF